MTEEGKNYVKDRPTLIIDLPVGSKVMPLNTRTLDSHQQIDLTEVLS